jgi:hypothetical protein
VQVVGEKPVSANLSTINPILIGLGSNPGLGGERAMIALLAWHGAVCLAWSYLQHLLTVTRAVHTWAGS